MKNMLQYGLMAPPAVHWLLNVEKDVLHAVKLFLADQAPSDVLRVAMAPSIEDMKRYRQNPKAAVLPEVKLRLRKSYDNVRSTRVLIIEASDADLETIAENHRQIHQRRREALIAQAAAEAAKLPGGRMMPGFNFGGPTNGRYAA